MAIDTSFLRQLNRFALILQNKVNSNYAGEHKSTATGSGLVLKDFVQYSTGDDFRRIDWKIFARTDRLYIKRYEEDRNLTIHILIDFSGSMGFGTKVKKSEYASMLALGFAYIALKNNEKFVISTFADALEMFKPKKGRSQLARIVEFLNNKKAKGASNFGEALRRYYKRQVKSRSMIVVISDFLYDTKQIEELLPLFRDHRAVFIQVLDKVETEMNLEGDYELVDAETRTSMRTFISPYLKRKYGDMMSAHQAKIKNLLLRVKGEFHTVSTKDDVFDSFFTIFKGPRT